MTTCYYCYYTVVLCHFNLCGCGTNKRHVILSFTTAANEKTKKQTRLKRVDPHGAVHRWSVCLEQDFSSACALQHMPGLSLHRTPCTGCWHMSARPGAVCLQPAGRGVGAAASRTTTGSCIQASSASSSSSSHTSSPAPVCFGPRGRREGAGRKVPHPPLVLCTHTCVCMWAQVVGKIVCCVSVRLIVCVLQSFFSPPSLPFYVIAWGRCHI